MRHLLAFMLTALVCAPALAQQLSDADATPTNQWQADSRLALPLPESVWTPASMDPIPVSDRRGSSVSRTVLPGFVGAVLGGWIGYVASQVVRSDWDKDSNGEFASYRMGFAAGGAALGAVTGVVLGRTLSGTPGTSGARPPRLARRTSQEVITEEEILASHARNGLELIQSLRPLWLNVRGTNRFGETATGTASDEGISITPGESPLKVYMNNSLIGDVTTLRHMSLGGFTEVRFYNSAQATYRWGQGHLAGAIEFIGTVPPR